ncbi:MAG: hypothetical protein JSW71_13390 [Gemmatimonadota bacterium]|nr:MAG: hypothetical protein JSW71_13390 [Gemmatimonadota bacterium]
MILANLQERLTAADLEFAVQALSQGDDERRIECERLLREGGIDQLLDRAELFELLRESPDLGAPSLELFVCVAVKHTLRRVGISDSRLSNYVGALLYEFGVRDRAFRITPHDDQVYRYVADIVADIDQQAGRRRFLLQAHLGNFTLWLSGIFPDRISERQQWSGGPDIEFYEAMGTRGFRQAANNRLARDLDVADIYARAADWFSALRVALNRLSDNLLFPCSASVDRLMRQVRDEFALGQ